MMGNGTDGTVGMILLIVVVMETAEQHGSDHHARERQGGEALHVSRKHPEDVEYRFVSGSHCGSLLADLAAHVNTAEYWF
ncbi:MAG: hypothetical protein V1791_13950 [Pseudomonadota bacterium]